MDFGVSGLVPEPRRGYRSSLTRDRFLQEFSDACWQRHQATHAAGGPINEWPNARTFKTNWPEMALQLIVADWKHGRAAGNIGRREPTIRSPKRLDGSVDEVVEQIEIGLLDPPKVEGRDWRALYESELALHPQLAFDLAFGEKGDGIEILFERAELKTEERWVVRDWLHGKTLAQIAEDSHERPQTIGIRLQNGLFRLRALVQARSRGRERGDVQDRGRSNAGRTRRSHVSRAPEAGPPPDPQPRPRRGLGSAGLARLRAEAAAGAHGSSAPALDGHGVTPPQRGFLPAVG